MGERVWLCETRWCGRLVQTIIVRIVGAYMYNMKGAHYKSAYGVTKLFLWDLLVCDPRMCSVYCYTKTNKLKNDLVL